MIISTHLNIVNIEKRIVNIKENLHIFLEANFMKYYFVSPFTIIKPIVIRFFGPFTIYKIIGTYVKLCMSTPAQMSRRELLRVLIKLELEVR